MLVFWWQGKGYQTFVIWILAMIAFGLILAVGKTLIPDRPWYWGLAFVAAAAINWQRGTKLNAKSRSRRQDSRLSALFYKSPHRFMSMPMETFSFVLVAIGAYIAIFGAM